MARKCLFFVQCARDADFTRLGLGFCVDKVIPNLPWAIVTLSVADEGKWEATDRPAFGICHSLHCVCEGEWEIVDRPALGSGSIQACGCDCGGRSIHRGARRSSTSR